MDPGCSCSSPRQCLVCHTEPVFGAAAADSAGGNDNGNGNGNGNGSAPAITGSVERCVVCAAARLLLAGRCVAGLTCHARTTRSSTNPALDGLGCRCLDRHCNKCYRTAAADVCHICRCGISPPLHTAATDAESLQRRLYRFEGSRGFWGMPSSMPGLGTRSATQEAAAAPAPGAGRVMGMVYDPCRR